MAKKETVSMTVRLSTSVHERLTKFCEDSGQSKTGSIERAISRYMDEYYADQEQLKQLKNNKNRD